MKTNHLPQFVTIGGQRFRIIIREMEDWGHLIFDLREIHLSSKACAKRSTLRETLRHEMLHAALHLSGVSFADRYDEESTVRAIENIFFPAWEKTRKHLEP